VAAVARAQHRQNVQRGYHGPAHPLLHGQSNLELTAHWTPSGDSRYSNIQNFDMLPAGVLAALYRDAKPAAVKQTYTQRDFSGFLPETLDSVGQVWDLNPTTVLNFLRQFHPSASLHLVSPGRRAGPDGAFAILRAISPSYLDIVCRIHGEFNVTPKQGSRPVIGAALPPAARSNTPLTAWYTPAFFLGRIIVNRNTGKVEYFRLGIPTDKSLNAHLTVSGLPDNELHYIIHAKQMELVGGDRKAVDAIPTGGAMDIAEAEDQLARQFYKFKDIDWVPFDQALATARDRNKPILAIVTWGALDDQSC
jgi:hypothetical protein